MRIPVGDAYSLAATAIKHNGLVGLREVAPRGLHREAIVLGCGLEELVVVGLVAAGPAPWTDGPIAKAQVCVGHDEVWIQLHLGAQTLTRGASSMGSVKGEGARLDLAQGDPALGTGEVLGEEEIMGTPLLVRASVCYGDDHHTVTQIKRRLYGVSQAAAVQSVIACLHYQAIHHGFDGVHLVAVEFDVLIHIAHFAVDAHADETRFAHIFEDALVVALAVLDQRSQDHDPAALGQTHDVVHDPVGGLLGDDPSALGAVRDADAGIEQPQVVVDLGDSADGGAGVVAGSALVYGDGRREALDLVHVWLLHPAQELAGVGREGLDITPLPFSVDGVEGQAGLAGAGDAGDDDELVTGHLHVDILEVVLPCAVHDELVLCHM